MKKKILLDSKDKKKVKEKIFNIKLKELCVNEKLFSHLTLLQEENFFNHNIIFYMCSD